MHARFQAGEGQCPATHRESRTDETNPISGSCRPPSRKHKRRHVCPFKVHAHGSVPQVTTPCRKRVWPTRAGVGARVDVGEGDVIPGRCGTDSDTLNPAHIMAKANDSKLKGTHACMLMGNRVAHCFRRLNPKRVGGMLLPVVYF